MKNPNPAQPTGWLRELAEWGKALFVAVMVTAFILLFVVQVIMVKGSSMEPNFYTYERVICEKISYRLGSPQRGEVIICTYYKGLNAKGNQAVQAAEAAGKQVVFWPDVQEYHIDGKALSSSHYVKDRVIKRIVGLPGESVSIHGGVLQIDGQPLDESAYWSGEIAGDMPNTLVPNDAYFVVGDNRNHSNDSRNPAIASIPRSRIMGRVVFRIWPLRAWGGVSLARQGDNAPSQ